MLVLNHITSCPMSLFRGDMNMVRQVMEVNFLSYVTLTAAAEPLLSRSNGSIVVVSSLAGEWPPPRGGAGQVDAAGSRPGRAKGRWAAETSAQAAPWHWAGASAGSAGSPDRKSGQWVKESGIIVNRPAARAQLALKGPV